MGQMAKIISENEQMSLPKLEESRRLEVDAKDLHELVVKEEGSTSPEPKEKIKEVETIPKMIRWGEVHEKFENEKRTLIL